MFGFGWFEIYKNWSIKCNWIKILAHKEYLYYFGSLWSAQMTLWVQCGVQGYRENKNLACGTWIWTLKLGILSLPVETFFDWFLNFTKTIIRYQTKLNIFKYVFLFPDLLVWSSNIVVEFMGTPLFSALWPWPSLRYCPSWKSHFW